jgi:cytochrome c553
MYTKLALCLLLPFSFGSLSRAAEPASQAAEAAEKLATQICSSCHGPGGNSISPTFPKLAAQQKPYLVAQIKAFREKTRGEQEAHDYMLGMATLIDDATADALGDYFAKQPPPPPVVGDMALIAQGKKLFEQGIPERGVAACATCHGAAALGSGIFPRLAGQHAEYVLRQLNVIQTRLRQSPVMHGIIKDLKPDEMKAVAAFVQSK